MHEKERRSGKQHESRLVLASLVMDRNPSLHTLTYEVVHLLEIGLDRRQSDRCTITFRVDMQARDQPDLRLRDTTVAPMNMPDDEASPTTTSHPHQMSHHTQPGDHQIPILTLIRSGPHRRGDTVSPGTTLRNPATMNLSLLVRESDPT